MKKYDENEFSLAQFYSKNEFVEIVLKAWIVDDTFILVFLLTN